jgi:hypothetical protein
MYVCMYICMHVCMYACMYVCMCVCVPVFACIYVHMYVYVCMCSDYVFRYCMLMYYVYTNVLCVCLRMYVMFSYKYLYIRVFHSQIAIEVSKSVITLIFRLFGLKPKTNFRLIFTSHHNITSQNKRIVSNAAVKTSNIANI